MADKSASVVVGQMTSLQIKPTFEGAAVPVGKISFDPDSSDLKGLVSVNAFVAGAEGIVNVPFVGVAPGTQDITVVFKYADAGGNANVENWGKSTKTISFVVTAADVARLENASSALTMNLWESKAFSFQVFKGENDILPSVTSVTVEPTAIADKFEFTSDLENTAWTFKSIQSSTTETITADAVVTIAGEDAGVPFSLQATVALTTNINDGSIPTNRFDVQFV
ncbi:hypothetical protein pETSU_131 [Edwardsiella phage pEt-SU]|uniref:Uncharacterized protein n=1 Tax=Edwardsiella phage pEt-SU TaxID=2562142 RepID=A0A4D6DWP1_9CAUD|nr:hypothetical protein HOV39_gp131 [Edwardsiella phage pEt-SU]QBZ70712.1 hypothetical protein pETSU_131 [Edwardsiella phage pEt-SU]